ncbi:flagellar basal body-associated FliL family protein [Nevskia sp.]|uniref:flagellar basal body-associated FliL family protein n=1 Tax=Nevskia sp. TaxID=1929292 RepID=UPI0026003F55|nr:flagellar basal body-associated FliL family protein [Nevskia sp.]
MSTAEAAAPPKSKKTLFIIIGAVVASAAISGGAVFFLTPKHPAPAAAAEGEGESAEAAPAEHGEAPKPEHGGGGEKAKGGKHGGSSYYPLTPAFVVNLSGDDTSHFLQVEMELQVSGAATEDALKQHNPQIRNSVLMLLSQQSAADVASRESKEALQAKVLAEIQRILTKETGKAGVDAVFFTSFVMQ